METHLIVDVMGHIAKGRRVHMRKSLTGMVKIKVRTGPFGLFVERYTTDHETWAAIRELIDQQSQAVWQQTRQPAAQPKFLPGLV